MEIIELKTWMLHALCIQSVALEGADQRFVQLNRHCYFGVSPSQMPCIWNSYNFTAIFLFFLLKFRNDRLWLDLCVWTAVNCIYYDVLHCLQQEGFLSVANQTHLCVFSQKLPPSPMAAIFTLLQFYAQLLDCWKVVVMTFYFCRLLKKECFSSVKWVKVHFKLLH